MAAIWLSLTFMSLVDIGMASGPTPIYINQVPLYSSLSSCAEQQVSTIVRGMYSGCGDGSQTTSYACFCLQSSVSFNSIISTAVNKQCHNDTAQASSALQVFASYCQLGDVEAITITSSQADSTASAAATSISASTQTAVPAASATTTQASSTSVPLSTSDARESGSLSTSATVGISVGVSLGVILLIAVIGVMCLKRRRRQRAAAANQSTRPTYHSTPTYSDYVASPASGWQQEHKHMAEVPHHPAELGHGLTAELSSER